MNMLAALPSLLLPVAQTLFSGTEYSKWINLALGIIVTGKNVVDRLQALDGEIMSFIDKGEVPSDDWWLQYTARSNAAHDVIQQAGDEAVTVQE